MPQEDVERPELPTLVELLYEMQLRDFSAHHDILSDTLRVIPTPDDRLTKLFRDFYDQLLYLQPGECDQCRTWHIRRHAGYWGASPLYCGLCLHRIINLFERNNRWPDANFEIPTSDRENYETHTLETQDPFEPGE